jgi:hypothetical protein
MGARPVLDAATINQPGNIKGLLHTDHVEGPISSGTATPYQMATPAGGGSQLGGHARSLLQADSTTVQEGRRVLVITFPAPAFLTTTVLLYMAPGVDIEVDAVMLGGYLDGTGTITSGAGPPDATPPVIHLYGSAEVTAALYFIYVDAGTHLIRLQLCCAQKDAQHMPTLM